MTWFLLSYRSSYLAFSGYYAYIEGTTPRQENDVARLISMWVKSSEYKSTLCLTFYYTMYGEHIGYLAVLTRTRSGTIEPVFRKNGDQGKRWMNAAIDLRPHEEDYQV